MTLKEFGGLERVLDNLQKGIDNVSVELKALDEKVDGFLLKAVTKDEFSAYQKLRESFEKENRATRRSNMQWSVGTIIAVLMLIMAGVTLIITTRPEVGPGLVDDLGSAIGWFL